MGPIPTRLRHFLWGRNEERNLGKCEESLKIHTCKGPLFLIKDNKKKRILCFKVVKSLILKGHDIDIIKIVPRDLLEEELEFNPPIFLK